jgi:phosphonate transport system substrate-binding protein
MKIINIIFFLCVIILTDFTRVESMPMKEGSPEKTLIIGLVPEQNLFKQIERYTPLAEYLSKKIGVKIRLQVLNHYENITDNFISLRLDGAFLGSFTYALANQRLGVEILARPLDSTGLSTYHGLILVRNDSGINNITNMKDKRFVFVDQATTAGFLFPLYFFKENGINDYKTYFKETYFAGTHEDVIYDVLNKDADIGAAKNTVLDRLSGRDGRLRRELKIIKTSPDVPENGLSVKKDLSAPVKTALQEAVLNMHNDPTGQIVLRNFGAIKFIRTTTKDYEIVFKYAREIGLDLGKYEYQNK